MALPLVGIIPQRLAKEESVPGRTAPSDDRVSHKQPRQHGHPAVTPVGPPETDEIGFEFQKIAGPSRLLQQPEVPARELSRNTQSVRRRSDPKEGTRKPPLVSCGIFSDV